MQLEGFVNIVCFSYQGEKNWGIYHSQSQTVTPLGHVWSTHTEVLAIATCQLAEEVERHRALDIASKKVVFLPPVSACNKIFCVGLNYGRHVVESGRELPEYPSLFLRHADSFVGHAENVWKPAVSDQFDYEGELVVVIGKSGRHIKEENAWDHVAGYTCMAENSVRDYQKHATQVTAGKNFDRSGALGPWIKTADGIKRTQPFHLLTRLNGVVVQNDSTADFIFSIPFLVAYVSRFTELKAGDLIATGTPEGVGMKRQPPLYMAVGDVLEIEIEQVGVLRVAVEAEAKS